MNSSKGAIGLALLFFVAPHVAGASGNECKVFQTLPKVELLEQLTAPELSGLSSEEIASTERGENYLEWCIVGEALRRLSLLEINDSESSSREAYRRRVFSALADLDNGTIPENGLFTADLIQKKILLKIRLLERARGESVLAANPEACDDGSCFGKQNGGSNSNNSGDKQSNHDADKTVDGILTTAVVPQTRPTYSKRNKDPHQPTEQQPTSACLPEHAVYDSPDPDVRENAPEIVSDKICYSVHTMEENGRKWFFQSFVNTTKPDGPAWFLPHDNESTAFAAAIYAVREYGGRALAIQNNEDRFFGGVDPNRNFGETKAEVANCASLGGKPTPVYSGFVYRFFQDRKHVLTLHNNSDGGAVSALARTAKVHGIMAKKNPISYDPDDFVYVAASKKRVNKKDFREKVELLLSNGLNISVEKVDVNNNDCSFSNFTVLRNREYYNIDVQHGHIETQKNIIDILVQAIEPNS